MAEGIDDALIGEDAACRGEIAQEVAGDLAAGARAAAAGAEIGGGEVTPAGKSVHGQHPPKTASAAGARRTAAVRAAW